MKYFMLSMALLSTTVRGDEKSNQTQHNMRCLSFVGEYLTKVVGSDVPLSRDEDEAFQKCVAFLAETTVRVIRIQKPVVTVAATTVSAALLEGFKQLEAEPRGLSDAAKNAEKALDAVEKK